MPRATALYATDAYNIQLQEVEISPLLDGEILIRSKYSSINYKDALALTGKGKILRKFPIVPGIDVSGEVIESKSPKFKVGDKVVVTGSTMGESRNGGYSTLAKATESAAVLLPQGLSCQEAMVFGTAGFTAGLCVERMEANWQSPKAEKNLIVTGASGGVGSFATFMFSRLGYKVTALSGKETAKAAAPNGKSSVKDYLKSLGAAEVLHPDNLHLSERPLDSAQWAGCVDNVGGDLLAGLIPHIDLYGSIACVGLAGGHEFSSSVMPLILRGVSLLGISSNNCSRNMREKIWQRLATDLKPDLSVILSQTISLEQAPAVAEGFINRKITGRVIIQF